MVTEYINAPRQIFIAVWSGGLEAPSYAAHATREIAIAKVAEAWLPDYNEEEGDTIDILSLDLKTLRLERLEMTPEEIAVFASNLLEEPLKEILTRMVEAEEEDG